MSKHMPAKSGEANASRSFVFALSKAGDKFKITVSTTDLDVFIANGGAEALLYSAAYMAVHHPRGKSLSGDGAEFGAEDIFSRIGGPGRKTVDPVVAAWARKRLKLAELEGWEVVEEVLKSKHGLILASRDFDGLCDMATQIGID
jgi:hypothetical protein